MIDVFLGVERPRADTYRTVGESAQRAVDIRSAVKTRPDRHIKGLIENAADLRGREGFATETQRPDSPRRIAMAKDSIAGDFIQAVPQPFG